MKRFKHSLSHTKLASFDMGELVPVACIEALPGDTFQASTSVLMRTQPLLAPIMHPVDVRIHWWFVPTRLVWEDFGEFITGGSDGMDESVYPTVSLTWSAGSPPTGNNIVGSLADYLGSVPGINALEMSALPFRAYQLIFNEFYRDEDLVSEAAISIASGADSTTDLDLQNIAWGKDYFTAARPWEQKGPTITVPLGQSAPITTSAYPDQAVDLDSSNGKGVGTSGGEAFFAQVGEAYSSARALEADLSNASGVTVTLLRQALALQRFEEVRAMFGSRFVEYLRYLGVRSSDARLQRPEYLGGGRSTIQFSEVLQTAPGDTSNVGDLKGHGIAGTRSRRWRYFAEEHGYYMCLMSVRPQSIYMQGLHRSYNRRTKEDYWQKELEHIGQQEVLNKEIYAAHSSPDGTFAYSDRYDEYRRHPSNVAGEFRDVLDDWHLARDFSGEPALNDSFVRCVPTDRVFAVQDQDLLLNQIRHSIQARRLVSKSAKPFIY